LLFYCTAALSFVWFTSSTLQHVTTFRVISHAPFHIPCAFVFHSIWMSRVWILRAKAYCLCSKKMWKIKQAGLVKRVFHGNLWNRETQKDTIWLNLHIVHCPTFKSIFNFWRRLCVIKVETRRPITIRWD
jgi:hypothetical protein